MRTGEATLTQSQARSRDYVALAKPRLNLLVVASTLVGYAMAPGEALGFLNVCGLLLGTGLVAGGASAFNQVLERDLDALMRRTRTRPLADQRLQPMEGVLFATAATLAGSCTASRTRIRRTGRTTASASRSSCAREADSTSTSRGRTARARARS